MREGEGYSAAVRSRIRLAPERRHYADEHIVRYLGEAVRDYHRLGAELVQRFLRDGAFAVAGDFQRVNASDGVSESREVARVVYHVARQKNTPAVLLGEYGERVVVFADVLVI